MGGTGRLMACPKCAGEGEWVGRADPRKRALNVVQCDECKHAWKYASTGTPITVTKWVDKKGEVRYVSGDSKH